MLSQKTCTPRWVILKCDPAVLPGSDYDGYCESLFTDKSKLKLDPHSQPSEFLMKPWTETQRAGLDAVDGRQKRRLSAMCCLVRFKNYEREDETGLVIKDHDPPKQMAAQLGEIIADDWMSAFNWRDEVLVDLHKVAFLLSEAKRPLHKPSSTLSNSDGSSKTMENTDS
jgi:hypothetical protein